MTQGTCPNPNLPLNGQVILDACSCPMSCPIILEPPIFLFCCFLLNGPHSLIFKRSNKKEKKKKGLFLPIRPYDITKNRVFILTQHIIGEKERELLLPVDDLASRRPVDVNCTSDVLQDALVRALREISGDDHYIVLAILTITFSIIISVHIPMIPRIIIITL